MGNVFQEIFYFLVISVVIYFSIAIFCILFVNRNKQVLDTGNLDFNE